MTPNRENKRSNAALSRDTREASPSRNERWPTPAPRSLARFNICVDRSTPTTRPRGSDPSREREGGVAAPPPEFESGFVRRPAGCHAGGGAQGAKHLVEALLLAHPARAGESVPEVGLIGHGAILARRGLPEVDLLPWIVEPTFDRTTKVTPRASRNP